MLVEQREVIVKYGLEVATHYNLWQFVSAFQRDSRVVLEGIFKY